MAYKPPIAPLTVHQKCNITPERKAVLRSLEIIKGSTEQECNSVFVGYAANAYSIEQVQNLYDALCLQIPDATHIACAFQLPGTDIAKCQGSIDDGEYGAGRTLLNILHNAKIQNKAIFVTRHYGGQHIGALRFKLIEKVAQAALDKILQQEKDARKPLTQQELQELNQQIAQQEQQRKEELQKLQQNPWHTQISPPREEW